MLKIENKGQEAHVYIDGVIGADSFSNKENTAARLRQEFKKLSDKALIIHINSEGGDAIEGFAICSAIKDHKAKTTAVVESLAASAASYIALACDEVKMHDYALLMIHRASTYVYGNAEELIKTSDTLSQIDKSISTIYAHRTGMKGEDILELMAQETWLDSWAALDMGFCDEVIKTELKVAAQLSDEAKDRYKNAPEELIRMSGNTTDIVESNDEQERNRGSKQELAVVVNGTLFKKEF